jgi:hypothetical protein
LRVMVAPSYLQLDPTAGSSSSLSRELILATPTPPCCACGGQRERRSCQSSGGHFALSHRLPRLPCRPAPGAKAGPLTPGEVDSQLTGIPQLTGLQDTIGPACSSSSPENGPSRRGVWRFSAQPLLTLQRCSSLRTSSPSQPVSPPDMLILVHHCLSHSLPCYPCPVAGEDVDLSVVTGCPYCMA